MSPLGREIHRLQNPALGSLLLWRFAKSHAEAEPQQRGALLPMAYLVLPMIWQSDIAEVIGSTMTGTGLRKFVAKFSDTEATRDFLLGIHSRAMRWRPKTNSALRMGFSSGLLGIDGARLVSRRDANEPMSNRTVMAMSDAADKLGVWFAQLSLHEIGLCLHVQF